MAAASSETPAHGTSKVGSRVADNNATPASETPPIFTWRNTPGRSFVNGYPWSFIRQRTDQTWYLFKLLSEFRHLTSMEQRT